MGPLDQQALDLDVVVALCAEVWVVVSEVVSEVAWAAAWGTEWVEL